MMGELAHNLESFNPAFTAVLLAVQRTIGASDYVRRDAALKNLIQPARGRVRHAQRPGARCRSPLLESIPAALQDPFPCQHVSPSVAYCRMRKRWTKASFKLLHAVFSCLYHSRHTCKRGVTVCSA